MAGLVPVPEDWSRALAVVAHPDDLLQAALALRADLAQVIRRHRPEVLLGVSFRESFGGPGWNHTDRRNLGVAVLDAARDDLRAHPAVSRR